MPATCKGSIPVYSDLLDADFSSMPPLSISELQILICDVITKWGKENTVSPAELSAALKLVKYSIAKLDIQYKDTKIIPVGYFSDVVPLSAEMIQLFLNVFSIRSQKLALGKSFDSLFNKTYKDNPRIIVLTLPQYNHLKVFSNFLQVVQNKNINIIVGGNIFLLKPELTLNFSECIFPNSILDILPAIERIDN